MKMMMTQVFHSSIAQLTDIKGTGSYGCSGVRDMKPLCGGFPQHMRSNGDVDISTMKSIDKVFVSGGMGMIACL